MVWVWIGSLILVYILVVFVLSRYAIPFMRRRPLPSRIPRQLEDAIAQIEQDSDSRFAFVKGCSEYILSTSRGGRFETILRLPLAFETDTRGLLSRRGFMHCHQLNHLLRLMLARSSLFTDEDIRLRTTFLNLCIHQYVQVRIAGQWYDVDLWGVSLGLPLGKHAVGFR